MLRRGNHAPARTACSRIAACSLASPLRAKFRRSGTQATRHDHVHSWNFERQPREGQDQISPGCEIINEAYRTARQPARSRHRPSRSEKDEPDARHRTDQEEQSGDPSQHNISLWRRQTASVSLDIPIRLDLSPMSQQRATSQQNVAQAASNRLRLIVRSPLPRKERRTDQDDASPGRRKFKSVTCGPRDRNWFLCCYLSRKGLKLLDGDFPILVGIDSREDPLVNGRHLFK